jgi:hypothetical protein
MKFNHDNYVIKVESNRGVHTFNRLNPGPIKAYIYSTGIEAPVYEIVYLGQDCPNPLD